METQSQHTPGPWKWVPIIGDRMGGIVGPKFEDHTEYLLNCNRSEDVICHFGSSETYYPTEGQEPSDADKALMLAAPDLLEACQNLENDDDHIPAHAWNMIQAAIAKATQP